MSELGRERYTLTAPSPVRSFVIAALVSIIGAALTVGSRALELGRAVLIVGIIALGFATALVLSAVILMRRLQSTLVLDHDGVTVVRGRRSQRLPWSSIDSVSLAGRRLILQTKAAGGSQLSVINPRSASDPTFTSLVAAIRGRLNADRGYRTD